MWYEAALGESTLVQKPEMGVTGLTEGKVGQKSEANLGGAKTPSPEIGELEEDEEDEASLDQPMPGDDVASPL
jgi:hypothetical protein